MLLLLNLKADKPNFKKKYSLLTAILHLIIRTKTLQMQGFCICAEMYMTGKVQWLKG
jgi:hypothetical protein